MGNEKSIKSVQLIVYTYYPVKRYYEQPKAKSSIFASLTAQNDLHFVLSFPPLTAYGIIVSTIRML